MTLFGRVVAVLFGGLLFSAPFHIILAIGYSNKAPDLIGILGGLVIFVFGFPWNILVAMFAVSFENAFAPGLFKLLNQNHDKTTGYFMFVGYVSVYINGVVIAAWLSLRNRDNQTSSIQRDA